MTIDYSCKYNEGVECPPNKRACSSCGWNPAVAAARHEQTLKELSAGPTYRAMINKLRRNLISRESEIYSLKKELWAYKNDEETMP